MNLSLVFIAVENLKATGLGCSHEFKEAWRKGCYFQVTRGLRYIKKLLHHLWLLLVPHLEKLEKGNEYTRIKKKLSKPD
uniref:Uncharacterized protein n=1 Tax=Arabidopsis thaliana TaxID=3702 RepID=Q5XVB8_ARATH|nr:hypothetical protein AT3G19530 [Arabidopsis thaliana]